MRPNRVTRWLLERPIHVKITGIGAVMLALVGLASLLAVRAETLSSLEEGLARETQTLANALAAQVEGPLLRGAELELRDHLDRARQRHADLAYAQVLDGAGHVLVEVEGAMEPPVLAGDGKVSGELVRLIPVGGALIADAVAPVLAGAAGYVRVGRTEEAVAALVARSSRIYLLVLALGITLAIGVALTLTWFLTRPLYDLLAAVRRVHDGDLSARAVVHAEDELGQLAGAFNGMVASLESSCDALERKERAREQLLEKVITSQEEERARLARDLHDSLGQSLSAMLLELRVRRDRGEACASVSCGLDRRIELSIDEVRRMSRGLRPSILDDYGLDSALSMHAADVARLSGVHVDCETAVSPEAAERLDRRVEVVLYRIAQEALNNVVRHAGASRASVVLYRRPDEVRLLVEDDGRGFDPEGILGAADGAGLGLMGMSERAKLLGGEVSVESEPGEGTVVRATIPVAGGGGLA